MKNLDIKESQLFPTFLYSVENLLDKKEKDKLLKYILKQYKPSDYTFQTKGFEKNKKHYKTLSNKINLIAKNIFDRHKLIYETFEITNMWSNVMSENNNIHPHSHANNYLSGVYYLKMEDNSSNIIFSDPRNQSIVISPKVSEWNIYNSCTWWMKPKENSVIFFPSWLQHYVELNKSKEKRISVAFNIMFKGFLGEEKTSIKI